MNEAFIELLYDNFRKWEKMLRIAKDYEDVELTRYILSEVVKVSNNEWEVIREKSEDSEYNIL